MDFIFMLTRADQTVPDCLEVLDYVLPLGLRHIGFKDTGVSSKTLCQLNDRIRSSGATSYLEVVSTTADGLRDAARLAVQMGVNHLLGGTSVRDVMEILGGSDIGYFPFAGSPIGHPTRLGGSPEQVESHCQLFMQQGCRGCDLLAYRATEAEPLSLVAAARRGLGDGTLLCAGSIQSAEQIHALAQAGCDAFTVGSAAFEGVFLPRMGSLRSQLRTLQAVAESADAHA